jgi:hypothetical protein
MGNPGAGLVWGRGGRKKSRPEPSRESVMEFQITVRYGGTRKRYHLVRVSAENARAAMETGAVRIPDEIADQADLVEIRPAVDPETREYLPGGNPPPEPDETTA